MKQQLWIISLLFASSTQAVSLKQANANLQGEQNKPGNSSNVDIDPESFAEASTNARIETDLEIAEGTSNQNQNELWKKHFQSSEFYKNYQAHLQHRGEMTHIRNLNNQALSQMKNEYKNLQGKYNKLSQQAKTNWDLGKKLAQQVPGGEQLFADQQSPASYENILLAEVVEDEDEEKPKKLELETVDEQNSSLNLNKDPSNPFNQKQSNEKDKISSLVATEDQAPAEEKEKWFENMPNAPNAIVERKDLTVASQLPHPIVKETTITTQPWSITVKTTQNPEITGPSGATKVSDVASPIDDSPVLEPLEPAVIPVVEHAHIYDNFPNQAEPCDDKKQETSPAASQVQKMDAKEPMASAILDVMDAPASKELVKIGDMPEEEPELQAPSDIENIQIRGLPQSETTSATVTTRPWSVTVIKTVNPPITGPAGSVRVSDWAAPISDSPVLEPLDPAEMPVVNHAHIYDNFPEQPTKCSELN